MTKKNKPLMPKGYTKVFEQLKADIQQTQLKAALSVTKELTMLYWRIGKALLKKSSQEGWGAKTLERLANDLLAEFPDTKGFSLRNLQYMRKFAKSYPSENHAAAAAQIPWGHNMLLLDKKHREKELEQGLMNHLQKFLLELGDGFAFIGRQYRIEIEGEDHCIDLLFVRPESREYRGGSIPPPLPSGVTVWPTCLEYSKLRMCKRGTKGGNLELNKESLQTKLDMVTRETCVRTVVRS